MVVGIPRYQCFPIGGSYINMYGSHLGFNMAGIAPTFINMCLTDSWTMKT